MKTPEELLSKDLDWKIFDKIHPRTATKILMAMEEYGKQQYNQAILDADKNVMVYSEFGIDKSHLINHSSILNLLKK